MSARQAWMKIAEKKKRDRELILAEHPEWRLKKPVGEDVKNVKSIPIMELSSREADIVRCDATLLLSRIEKRQYTSLEVAEAYCHAATIAQELTNCLTEVFFEDALAQAKVLDAYMDQTGKTIGPLHGLPVSVKDHIMIKGKDTSTGYISWCYKSIADKDAVAVAILRNSGAILFVKTNNPQTLLSLETDNNIYGKTTNPFNRSLTSGGSSGGESALIALHGSPIGLGTDIGGSIRQPAACTGLYGFKASVARIPHAGLRGSHDGMDAIIGVLGPLARSARDLALFCRVMLQHDPWLLEPPLLQIPWKQDLVEGRGIPSKLCFAILWDDGVVTPHPPILDALKKCKSLLIQAGHLVIDWTPMNHKEAWDLLIKLYFLDGGKEYWATLAESGEPPVPQTKWILDQVPNDGKPFSIAELFRLNQQREAFRLKLLEHWNDTSARSGTGRPVDAIIAPVAPTLAPKHDTTRWWGYTSYWNLADYPAAVFPMGTYVHGSEDAKNLIPAVRTYDNDYTNDTEFASEPWNPDSHNNIPVCLQIIGRRLNEERLLGMLNVVESVLKRESMGNSQNLFAGRNGVH